MSIYYSPEDFNLTIVDMVEKEPDYDFDMIVVWSDAENNLYWATDAGCSCPVPFENHTTISSLDRLTKEGWDSFESYVNECSFPGTEAFLRTIEKKLFGR